MSDSGRSPDERQAAHRRCLAVNARLMRLIRQAGGSNKLFYVAWDDAALNRLNYNIMIARDAYLSVCYYGPRTALQFGVKDEDPSHVEARRELAELR